MKKLLTTAALLLATATSVTAQEDALCAPEDEMTAAMADAGYVPFVGGFIGEEGAAFWFYLNPFDGTWMIHSVDLLNDRECHETGGEEFMILGEGT